MSAGSTAAPPCQVHSIEIIGGKFLAVFAISLLTAGANVVSLAFTLRRILPGEFEVSFSVYALTFALLVPVTFLFAALFLALACFARDYKDGQNVLMPVYLPITLLAGLTSLPGIELNAFTAFAPILNIALLIKALFLGETAADLVLLTLGSSALYAALSLVLAARVFESTNVLLGGKESATRVLGIARRDGGTVGKLLGHPVVVRADHRIEQVQEFRDLREVVGRRIDADHRVAAAVQQAVEQ